MSNEYLLTVDVELIEKWLIGISLEDIGTEGIGPFMHIVYQFVTAYCELAKYLEENEKEVLPVEDVQED